MSAGFDPLNVNDTATKPNHRLCLRSVLFVGCLSVGIPLCLAVYP